MAAIEESFEALTLSAIAGLGAPERALQSLQGAMARGLQSPSPENLRKFMQGYLEFDPEETWRASLKYSSPAYRDYRSKTRPGLYRTHTIFNQDRVFSGRALSSILGRFVRIRNSFAHQDSSVAVFLKDEVRMLHVLRARRASSDQEEGLITSISAVCSLLLDSNACEQDDPVAEWALAETHAINSVNLFAGMITSTCHALAEWLRSEGGIEPTEYEPLVFRIQSGRWSEVWDGVTSTPLVEVELTSYKPSSRGVLAS